MSGERYVHPLRRYAPRPACLRGTVCWRGAGGCNYSLPCGRAGEGSVLFDTAKILRKFGALRDRAR